MAYEITSAAEVASSKNQIEPNIVLKINGVDEYYGIQILETSAKFGQSDIQFGDPDLVFGGLVDITNSDDNMALSGTTDSITQQLEPDKGAASSTQTMKIKLIDFDGKMTRLISPGVVVDDVLYRDCVVYMGFKGTSFPEDYIQIFNGKIQQISTPSGAVEFTIAHPDDLKRTDIFTVFETTLALPLNYFSKQIQDLFYSQRSDVDGTVQIQYVNSPFLGDVANISVSGNLITATIEAGVTKAKTIKREIENDEFANQLVSIKVNGDKENPQTAEPITNLVVSTDIYCQDVSGFLLPQSPIFETFVRVGDEIIQYTGIDTVNNRLTGCTRSVLNTFGSIHETDDEVKSFYQLGDGTNQNGNAIDLALKILLSNGPEFYIDQEEVDHFVDLGIGPPIPNSLIFNGKLLKTNDNVTIGDTVTISGDPNPANNVIDAEIIDIQEGTFGTYIILGGVSLVSSLSSPAVCSFKSRYNVLRSGVGLSPSQVDIDRFEYINSTFTSNIANYRFYLKDTLKAKDFINEQIFLPSGLFSIPRKGRVSVGFTAPPLFAARTKTLDADTVKKASSLVINRSISKNFYNAIVYRYNEDSLEEKSLSGRVTLSNDSTNRIAAPTKAFTITANGLRPSGDTSQLIERLSARFLSRYEFAAESLEVDVPFKTGWDVEVGDSIIFGDEALKVSDSTNGTRNFDQRLFEVLNKSLNWKTGQVKLTIIDANYSQGLRYAVFSPASKIDSGSTTTKVKILDSYGTEYPRIEKNKWEFYIGKTLSFHSADWTTEYFSELQGFDPSDNYAMIVDPALPAPPTSGWIVSLPNYDDIPVTDKILKNIHLFWNPTVDVVSGISQTQFQVSVSDFAKFFVGGIVRIHNDDYSIDSGIKGKKITSLIGPDKVVVQDLGFVPAAGQKVEFIGFVSDNGKPYAWL
jgi:hypothetical protein